MAKVTKKGREKAKRKLLNILNREALPTSKRLAPVETGELRDSLQVKIDEGVPYLFSDKDYAPYIEFGTLNQNPQQFLRPAIRQLQD